MAEKIKQEYYPREAIARGIEGDVVVLLTLELIRRGDCGERGDHFGSCDSR